MTALFILGLVIVLTVILTLVAQILVSAARSKYKIIAPKTVGNDNFERAFRAHQNQLEANSLFIPLAFLQFPIILAVAETLKLVFNIRINYTLLDILAPGLVLLPNFIWLAGRAMYIYGYNVNNSKVKFIGGISSGVALILVLLTILICGIITYRFFSIY